MKNVSNDFKNIIKSGGPFYAYAKCTLLDGTELTFDGDSDFYADGNSFFESGGSGFPLGVALSKQITITLDNHDERYSEYDFFGAKIVLYTEADISNGAHERVLEGAFTVIDSVAPDDALEINAYDNMYKLDADFTSSLSYPVALQQLWNELCNYFDLGNGSPTFLNDNYVVQSRPEAVTGREMAGYIAQIAVGNAYVNANGQLCIKSYDFSPFDNSPNLSGGKIGESVPDTVSAGGFGDGLSEIVSGGEFGESLDYYILSDFTTAPEIATDDVTITGITTVIEDEESGEETTLVFGTEDYALEIDNPLIIGNEEQAITVIGQALNGVTIRPFSGDFSPAPSLEFMDMVAVIDRKGNVYQSFVTDHTFTYLGGSSISNDTESPERNAASYSSNATKIYKKVQKDLIKQRTAWETAIGELSDQVANASGLYTTEEKQPDGSTIFYMHNKPTLEESDIIWKMTAETLTVSTDGGKSWNAGITVNGEVIAKIMTTIGINFNWGVGGTLIIEDADGNQTAYIDAETGAVRLKVESLEITGKTVDEIAAEQAEEAMSNFVDSVYTPDISQLQAQIDGQIMTWFYDYVPTTTNYPASEWTTDAEKDQHLGDLFYVVDNAESGGQAYRWAKIDNVYTWDYVEDTAVTKALAAAQTAQDTADSKRRVFVNTPTPPYDIGDLWTQGPDGDIMRCVRTRTSGTYVSSDWAKASKYTDDTSLENFINGDFQNTIDELNEQADKKAETWYQSSDPSTAWITTALKNEHIGDIWYNTTSSVQKSYRWNGTSWQEMKTSPPDEVFDEIDGKAQIFINQPTPPYSVGDLWFNSATSDIMTCVTSRESGSFNAADWQKRNKYTDDSSLNNFINGDFQDTVSALKTQSDQKAETWYQSSDPSTLWSESEKLEHAGDVWYNISTQKSYIYSGSKWQEMKTTPPDEVFDTIDGKAQIFISQPTPPYSKGDLWFNSVTSDIMTCITTRSTGSYNSSDWQKRNKYTDDSYAEQVQGNLDDLDESLNQQGVFNRLTNNGQTQGIYISGGKIYINASYIGTGTLSANYIKGGTLTLGGSNNTNGSLIIRDGSGAEIGRWNNNGLVATKGTFTGTVYANSGTFRGTVYASSGTFTGTVYANAGTFKGYVELGDEGSNTTNYRLKISGSGYTLNASSSGINISYGNYSSWLGMDQFWVYSTDTFRVNGVSQAIYCNAKFRSDILFDQSTSERRIGWDQAGSVKHNVRFYGRPTNNTNNDIVGMYDATAKKGIWGYGADGAFYVYTALATNKITINSQGLNNQMVLFDSERQWYITNVESGANNQLWFCSTSNKSLGIHSNENGTTILMNPAQGSIDLGYDGRIWNSSIQHLYLRASSESAYVVHLGVHDGRWALDPDTNGNVALGTQNHRWTQLFATTSTIATSDETLKNSIQELDPKYLDFFKRLTPVTYKFNDGTSGRTHIGFISQRVKEAMDASGISDLEFAGYCRDKKTIQVEKSIPGDENAEEPTGETYKEDVEVEDECIYSLRYEEFIALNTRMIQECLKEIENLKTTIRTLEGKIYGTA